MDFIGLIELAIKSLYINRNPKWEAAADIRHYDLRYSMEYTVKSKAKKGGWILRYKFGLRDFQAWSKQKAVVEETLLLKRKTPNQEGSYKDFWAQWTDWTGYPSERGLWQEPHQGPTCSYVSEGFDKKSMLPAVGGISTSVDGMGAKFQPNTWRK
jgi:hypothetical protein